MVRRRAHTALLAAGLAAAGSVSGASQPATDPEAVFRKLKQLATERSTELRLAEAADSQARARHFKSWSRWLPRVDLQLSQTRSRDFSVVTSGAIGALGAFPAFTPLATSLSRWQFNASMPIYRRGVHLGVEQASAERGLARERLLLKQGELDWRMRSLFGAYLLQAYKVATVGNSMELARTNLRETKLRFELGQKTRIDLLRAEANVARLESTRLSFLERRAADRNAFLEYSGLTDEDLGREGVEGLISGEEELGRSIDRFTGLEAVLEAVHPYVGPEPAAPDAADPAAALVESRISDASPRYRAYLEEENLSVARARAVVADDFPDLSLQGSLSKQSPDWTNAFSSQDRSYSMALVLNIPLFSSGGTISSHFESANGQETARLAASRDIRRFRNEVEDARVRIRSLTKSLQALRLGVTQNEEIVRLSYKSYQLGRSSIVELLGSQDDLIEAKVELAQAKLDLSTLARQLAWNLALPLPEKNP